ncbi:hypothetical protein AKJ39_01195 [candidate division MSBL1 archaeon SCGC-AAA259J03]|uniref:Aminoacyl-transfer RNA synthetases class-II family profile domain-containing protein n=2 Tax=candidate division MSBL1 TaxID=215777 RepID=A0A656YXK8_9EURY|nr:hypothetical protein AKJ36_02235 [candidate division MSBL1 archaeon SCGC-AAA259I07]KXA98682.1 hypothetical protein AKJ39_01195 [candidate division MSBL1 archaeon SCGC-AAA259J03]
MKFDIDRLKEKSEKDYESAWKESGELIKKIGKLFSLEREKGSLHPLFELVQEFREILSSLGFQETVVPALIERDEIRKQYGPETPVILDRVFFLAGLDRSDLGISREYLEKIREEVPGFDDLGTLKKIFRRYKKGEIASDDLAEVMMEELGIGEEQASYILSLFESFKNLEPIPSDMTLRSHTTAGWFQVLQEMQFREPLPVQLFTVGPKYRREQKLDETHLYRSWTASLVIMAEEISLEDGEEIAREILKKMGFGEIEFKTKGATSKYYAPGSEFEIFVEHPETGEEVEIGNAGFYSPVSLANYEIPYPVFNLGIGLERILMIRTGEKDIRHLVYSYRYKDLELSDNEISRMISVKKKPTTDAGKKLAKKIEKIARKCRDKPSPCEFQVFEGNFNGKEIKVELFEPEENTKLIGPAAFNQIYVNEGNIIGVPSEGWEDDEFLQKARKKGTPTGITYIKAFANLAALKIEEMVRKGKKKEKIRKKIIESLNNVNLEIERPARRYITNHNKKIDVRGPMFITVIAEQINS